MPERYNESGELTNSAHKSDHAFVKELKEKAEKHKEIKDKVTASLITAFIWSVLSGIGAIIWYAFNEKVGK